MKIILHMEPIEEDPPGPEHYVFTEDEQEIIDWFERMRHHAQAP